LRSRPICKWRHSKADFQRETQFLAGVQAKGRLADQTMPGGRRGCREWSDISRLLAGFRSPQAGSGSTRDSRNLPLEEAHPREQLIQRVHDSCLNRETRNGRGMAPGLVNGEASGWRERASRLLSGGRCEVCCRSFSHPAGHANIVRRISCAHSICPPAP
jgi:hypothetical protein